MDTTALRLKVFEKTGQKIAEGDPIFLAVALNDVLLEETILRINAVASVLARHVQVIHSASEGLESLVLTKAEKAVNEACQSIKEELYQTSMSAVSNVALSATESIQSAQALAVSTAEQLGKKTEVTLSKSMTHANFIIDQFSKKIDDINGFINFKMAELLGIVFISSLLGSIVTVVLVKFLILG